MAEFGTPETWNMKVGDFIETELPKEKPQALLDLQEQNRKQRLLDTLQKIGPGLMDESLDFIRRQNFGLGGLTEEEVSILKQAIKDGKLTQAEFNKLSVKPPADSKNFGGGRKGMEKRNWFGVTQRENKKLFRKVKNILSPGAADAGSILFNNETAKNIITKAANAGKNNQEIVKLLEKANVDFGGTSISKTNKVASTVNSLVKRGAVDEIYTRSAQALKTTGELTDFELKQKVKSTVEDLIKNPEKYADKSLSTIQRETLGRADEKGRFDVLKNEIKKQLGDKKGTKFIQDNFESTTEFSKRRLETLLKDKKIQNLLKSKDVSFKELEKQIAKVLKVDINSNDPSNAAYRLAEVIKDEPDFVDVKIPRTYLNSAEKILDVGKISGLKDPFSSIKRQRMEKKIAKELGQGSTFFSKLRKQTGISGVFGELAEEIGGPFKKLVGISTDELGTIKGPYKYGSEGDSIFMQSVTKTGDATADNINLEKGKSMDKKLVEIKELIAKSKTFPTEEVEKYNTEVRKIATEMNANLGPNAKPIRPFIIVPGGDPTKTIANFSKIAEKNPDVAQKIINDAEKFGYSARITKDVPTAFDLQDKNFIRKNIVDNLKKFYKEYDEEKLFKKIRNQTPKQIRDIFGKGRKFLRFVEAESDDRARYASSPNIMSDAVYVDDEPESFVERNPITTGVAAAVTPLATKKGRSIYGTAGKGLLKALQTLGTPFGVVAGEALLPGGVRSQLQEEGLEQTLRNPLSYAGLPLANIGAEAVKNPALQRALNLGLPLKAIRAGTPIGLGLMGVSALVDSALKFQEEFDALSPEEQKAYLKEQEEFGEDVQGAAEGGIMRLGFADGPKDPSKRKFMKLMGILSLLPYGLGKLIKPAAKVAPVVAEGVKLGFDKFMMLVNKIKELGTPTSKVTQKEREVGYTYTGKDGSEYELVEDLTTGDIRVTKDKPGFTMSGDEAFDTIEDRSTFVLTKGQADETTKGKKPPDEYEEVKEVAGPDGTFDDVDEISDTAVKEVLDEID